MTPTQMKALQRYMSALVVFMLHHRQGTGNITEYLAAKANLEAAFGTSLPQTQPRQFADIL